MVKKQKISNSYKHNPKKESLALFLWEMQQQLFRILSVGFYFSILQWKKQPMIQTETDPSSSFKTNPNQSILNPQISSQVNALQSSGGLLSKHLYLTTSFGIKLKAQLHIHDKTVSGTGIFVHTNGFPLTIGDPWVEIVESLLKKDQNIIIYHYSRTQKTLKFKVNSKIKMETIFPQYNLIDIANKLAFGMNKVEEALLTVGLSRRFKRKTLALKEYQLRMSKQIVQIILSKTIQPVPIMLLENVQSPIKMCSILNQIPNPAIQHQDKVGSSEYTTSFIIKHRTFEVQEQCEKTTKIKQLAIKTVNEQSSNKQKNIAKIQRQYEIIKKITNPEHALIYWQSKNKKHGEICMDYVRDTLWDLIYNRYNSIEDILDFAHQIVSAVTILHQSHIVHRDLKPQNILVENLGNKKYKLKIIDFGESCLMSNPTDNPENLGEKLQTMGHTLPYSPLQCTEATSYGLFNKQIDYWSVGLLLYELCFKKNPISYSQSFSQNISKGWKIKDEFSIFPNLKVKRGLQKLGFSISIVALHSIQVQQNQRLPLHKIRQIIQISQRFLEKVKD